MTVMAVPITFESEGFRFPIRALRERGGEKKKKKANEEKREFSGSVAHGAADWYWKSSVPF
jgi:hypothetical protein